MVAFEIPCLRGVVTAGTGTLVAPFDVDTLGRAVVELLHDPPSASSMGQTGRRAARRFDWDDVGGGPAPGVRRGACLALISQRRRTIATGASIALLTAVLRGIGLARAYDVFVDEITYVRLGESLAFHLSVNLYDEPLYLHPPAFFALEAVPLRLLGSTDAQVLDVVLAMRWLNVALAAVSAILAVAAGHPPGGVVARRAGGGRPLSRWTPSSSG